MKSGYVSELRKGPKDQAVTSFFLVREKEIRVSKAGKPWLRLSLADRTGTIAGKMWDNFAEPAQTFECDDIVRVRGRVDVYQDEPQLIIEQILRAVETDYALDDFLPHTKHDVDRLYSQLRDEISTVRNPWLQRLLLSFVDDPEIGPKLKRAPAAMTMHHAYLGGLLEHIVSLCGLAKVVAQHYPEVDRDLLLAGIVLHDIGKTEELCYKRAISYSTEGQLLGHIVIGLGMVRQRIDKIPDFPRTLAVLVEHLIVSHHGTYEFGSPKLPVVREAVLLNHLDDLDSKMAAMRATLDGVQTQELWTERNAALRRTLLNSAAYLLPRESAPPRVAPTTQSAQAAAKPGGLFGAAGAARPAATTNSAATSRTIGPKDKQ
ncbi:MAG TPA: HD domain-containing protein [Candidatus Acidoferrales bacterium]|nr:HD domain-containing protein [Candidatus Acidoferrales bacterium]